MNAQTVFVGTFLIVLVLLIVFTWTKYPNARYIVLSRTDGDATKYIAINDIEVIDNRGARKEIIGIEGKGIYTSGFANANSASQATAATVPDIKFDGNNAGYVRDSYAAANTPTIGPVVAFVPSSSALMGYLIFTLGCNSKIAKINIKSPEDDTSRVNLQRVKVYLLDKDKVPIKGAEQVIPFASAIPQSIHHIMFT